MNDQQLTNHAQQAGQINSSYSNEDEINLKDLAKSVWRTRKVLLISLVIVSLLFWGGWIIKKLKMPERKVYSLPISLNFKGLDKREYPNGSRFDRLDIISPDVIKSVYDQHQLGQYGLKLDKFFSQVRVIPFNVNIELIKKKYRLLLEGGKKVRRTTLQEINEIRRKQNDELKRANLRGLQVTFSPRKSKIPLSVIKNVLFDIPKVWALKAINERGVLDANISLSGVSVLDKEILGDLDYMLAIDYIAEKINIILQDIKKLEALPNGLTVKDVETGLKLTDLNNKINDIRTYLLIPLSGPIQTMGISKNPEVTLFHYLNKKLELETEKQESVHKADLIGSIYSDYMQKNNGQNYASQQKNSQDSSFSHTTTQLGDSFLDRIINMSDKSSDIAYRQGLIDEKKQFDNQAINIETTMVRVQRNIDALQGKGPKANDKLKQYFLAKLEAQLPVLLDRLIDVVKVRERIQKLIITKATGSSDAFYTPISNVKTSGGKFKSIKRDLIIYLLALVLTTIIVVPVVMIRNSFRKPEVT